LDRPRFHRSNKSIVSIFEAAKPLSTLLSSYKGRSFLDFKVSTFITVVQLLTTTTTTLILEHLTTVKMGLGYHVAEPNSYLVITGAGIEKVQIRKKVNPLPFLPLPLKMKKLIWLFPGLCLPLPEGFQDQYHAL